MTPAELHAQALREIAAATVKARAQVTGMTIPEHAARELLNDVESILTGLIVNGAVPGPPKRPSLLG